MRVTVRDIFIIIRARFCGIFYYDLSRNPETVEVVVKAPILGL